MGCLSGAGARSVAICVGVWLSPIGCSGSRPLEDHGAPDAAPRAAPPDGSSPAAAPDASSPAVPPDGSAVPDARSPSAGPDAAQRSDGSPDSGSISPPVPASVPLPIHGAGTQAAASPITLAGACDVDLRPTRTWQGAVGTLAAPGPYRTCAVIGGQAFQTLVVSSDGRRAAGIGAGGQVQVLDARTLASLGTFMRARGGYKAVAISGDGARIATGGGRDGELDVWSVDDHALLVAVDLGTSWPNFDGPVAISTDGGQAAMTTHSTTLVVDLATGTPRVYPNGFDSSGLAFVDGDGKLAVDHYGFSTTGAGYGSVGLLDLESGAFQDLFEDPDFNVLEQTIASADGRTIVTSGDHLRIWDAATGAQRADFVSSSVGVLGISADGSELVTETSDGAGAGNLWMQRRRLSDGSVSDEVSIGPLSIAHLFTGGGMLLATQYPQMNVPILVAFDLAAHRALARACSAAPAAIQGFSQDGSRLLNQPNDLALAFDTSSGEPISPSTSEMLGQVWRQIISPDGRKLAWALLPPHGAAPGPVTAQLADIDEGTTVTLAGQKTVSVPFGPDIAFSADSSKLAVVDGGNQIMDVFDVATTALLGEQAVPFVNGGLFGFTPDGQALRLANQDGEQTVSWQDGSILASWAPPSPPGGGISATSFDGRTVTTTDYGSDGTLYRDEAAIAALVGPEEDCFGANVSFGVGPGGGVAWVGYDCGRPWMSRVGPFVQLLDASTGAELQTIHNAAPSAFSWDGSTFADGDTLWCR